MKLDTIHHIAIIGRDRDAMLHFYVDQLGFAIVSEYDRPERGDILINLRQGKLTLELFIKPTAPERPKLPLPGTASSGLSSGRCRDLSSQIGSARY